MILRIATILCVRSGDEGSLVTLDKLSKLESMHKSQGIDFSYSGAGYYLIC